jgi:iron(II)-dependent oxidoreductase
MGGGAFLDKLCVQVGRASPFGVQDLIGNVWQMTDEVIHDHTHNLILKGGSQYQPQGSHWYFP